MNDNRRYETIAAGVGAWWHGYNIVTPATYGAGAISRYRFVRMESFDHEPKKEPGGGVSMSMDFSFIGDIVADAIRAVLDEAYARGFEDGLTLGMADIDTETEGTDE